MYWLCTNTAWRSNRGNLHTLLGNIVFYQSALTYVCFCPALGELNDSTVTIPLEGDEIVPVPETNDVDEVEEGIYQSA